jgi:hypothetical protein
MVLRSAATMIIPSRRLVYMKYNLFVYEIMNSGTKEESECFLLLILATDDSVYPMKKGKIVE